MNERTRTGGNWLLGGVIGLAVGAAAGVWWTALYSSNPQDITSPSLTAAVLIVVGIVIFGAAGVFLAAIPSTRPLGRQLLFAVVGSAIGAFVAGFIGAVVLGPGS